MSGPLAGWRILDLTQGIAGPFTTKLFSDYGADVVKVERPGAGDVSRRIGPFPGDVPHPEHGGMYRTLNTGKRSVTLNLKSATGRAILERLVQLSDLVVESFRPQTLERLGLAPERLEALNPACGLVRISSYGQTGPKRDWEADDLLLYAASGVLQITGDSRREPVAIGLFAPLFLAGAMAAPIAIAVMRAARRDGKPEVADLSIQELLAGSVDRAATNLVAYQYSGALTIVRREPTLINALPNGVFPAIDGYVHVFSPISEFDRICRVLGHLEWLDDGRMQANLGNPEEIGAEIEAVFYEWLSSRPKQQAMEEAQAAGWVLSALNGPADVFRDPHLAARGFFTTVPGSEAVPPITLPGIAARFSDTPGELRRAPLLGEHNSEILGEIGIVPSEIAALRSRGVI